MDWKDLLASMKGNMPHIPETEASEEKERVTSGGLKQKEKLHILIERKGRAGKVATIIEGFTLSDEEVMEIASELKKKIGTGGSARGGEILLQGDWREKAKEMLTKMGFKI